MVSNRNAMVTGASSGLGRELARQLVVDRGMTVLATARRRERLEELAAEMPGGVDVVVNNAGMGNYADFATQDPDAIRQIIELNIVALIDLSQKAARHMRARGTGQIVQISSILGFFGIRASAVYVASKHAVNGLVKCMRQELWGTGVRVWAACPGRTASEFREVALGDRAGDVGKLPTGESTAKVARAIVRGLDRHGAFLIPSWKAWVVANLAYWLPGPFEWVMGRWAPRTYRKLLEKNKPT
jgi:short-subunit dehydrogenase